MPGADGLAVLRHAREIAPQALVLLMTAHATVDTAVEAIRRGAQDYLLKPVIFDDVLHKVEHLLEHRQIAWENQMLRSQVERHWDFENLVGRSGRHARCDDAGTARRADAEHGADYRRKRRRQGSGGTRGSSLQ